MSSPDKRVRKKRRWGKVFEYTSYERTLLVGDDYDKMLSDLEKEYAKKKNFMITPNELAARNDIRVSIAKQLLSDLEEKKLIKKTDSNNRLKIYIKA